MNVPLLGIATRFESNSRFVLDLAEAAFGEWRALAPQHTGSLESAHVRVIVYDDVEHAEPPSPVRHISTDDGRLFAHASGCFAVVDPSRRESLAYVTTTLVSDHACFRETVLEAITFALLANYDRHPIHAAAIARDGRALLLAAPSGTGKSTLAYLAHRCGMHVLSDDHVWVQLQPALRIWGGPATVRLLVDAPARFPELSRLGPASIHGGKQKHTLPLGSRLSADRFVCERATLCVMTRGTKVALERIGGSALEQELAGQLTPGFDRFTSRHGEVVHALTADGGWRLTLSDDPDHAMPILQRMLDEL